MSELEEEQANFQLFTEITEQIAKLNSNYFAQLRTWLVLHSTIEDWRALMKT